MSDVVLGGVERSWTKKVGLVGKLRTDHPEVRGQTWKRLKSSETIKI